MHAELTTVPVSISAKSPQELTKKMLFTNLKDGFGHTYSMISFDGKVWTAWYLSDMAGIIKSKVKSGMNQGEVS